jgi:murein DD-endopeptidase MepM/ murein hydrolase activator NlpD
MQIILIAKNSRSRVIRYGAIDVLGLLLLLVAVCGFFYVGKLSTNESTQLSITELYHQTASGWTNEMYEHKKLLAKAQENAEKNLDALASRLSLMQAHVLRLDALGARLADMTNVNDISFDSSVQPGIGGPQPGGLQASMKVDDFITALHELDAKIKDRSEKLHALESLLIEQSLSNLTIPSGKPIIEGWISSLFGKRTNPITGKVEFHEGIDFAGKIGSPIVAVASGIVTWSGPRYGYGNMVEINHGNGYQTRYAHNKKNLVTVGQKVERGEHIALMGSSGRSTGPHVHYEVVSKGKALNPNKIHAAN